MHVPRSLPRPVLRCAATAVLLVGTAALAQQSRERCATRLSLALLGRSPTAAMLAEADPQAGVDAMVASPEFQEKFARFINASFNDGPGEVPAEDAAYYLSKYVLQNNLAWKDLFVGAYRVRPGATATADALVEADPNGLGYFRSGPWMRRYAGVEAEGYRLVAAYRILQNTVGLRLTAAANTDGIDATGRMAASCAGCHYEPLFGLDLVARVLSKKVVGSNPITFTPSTHGPQVLLGGLTIANDSQLVNAIVNSNDFRFNTCRLAGQFLYARPEYKCEGVVFDQCMAALTSTGKVQAAVAAIAKHSSFCQ